MDGRVRNMPFRDQWMDRQQTTIEVCCFVCTLEERFVGI